MESTTILRSGELPRNGPTVGAETIEIVCASDTAYIPHLSALLKSIECNKGKQSVRVHLILDSVGDHLMSEVVASVPNLILQTYHVSQHQALELPPLLQISRATYLRLLIDEVLAPEIDRIIFLDVDMIVTTSLQELWMSELKGNAVGAVLDPGVNPADFARQHDLDMQGVYFNAGMLVVNMQMARDGKIFSRALSHLLRAPDSFEFADQDALNLVLWQHWTKLDPAWNFQRKFLYQDFSHHYPIMQRESLPKIIHFTEAMKPWRSDEWHPYGWLYWRYLRLTPFFRVVMSREQVSTFQLMRSGVRFLLRKLKQQR